MKKIRTETESKIQLDRRLQPFANWFDKTKMTVIAGTKSFD